MKIKEIECIDEIRDPLNDSVDVGVTFEDNHSYTIVVSTPQNLLQEMEDEQTNFLQPGAPEIIVKELTDEIITEAIEAYFSFSEDGYWLKLCQFGDQIDVSALNKLDSEQRKEYNYIYGKGFDPSFPRYSGFSLQDRGFLEGMGVTTSLIFLGYSAYSLFQPESFGFCSQFGG